MRPDFTALFAFCDLHATRIAALEATTPFETPLALRLELSYSDRQGFPLPHLDWARLLEDPEYKLVARDELPDGSLLSTVWLGLDHALSGRPLFFETMRFARARGHPSRETIDFPDPETGEAITQLRYGSEEEALAAHHEILARLRVRLGH